jgi:hypothetical protein
LFCDVVRLLLLPDLAVPANKNDDMKRTDPQSDQPKKLAPTTPNTADGDEMDDWS